MKVQVPKKPAPRSTATPLAHQTGPAHAAPKLTKGLLAAKRKFQGANVSGGNKKKSKQSWI